MKNQYKCRLCILISVAWLGFVQNEETLETPDQTPMKHGANKTTEQISIRFNSDLNTINVSNMHPYKEAGRSDY